MPMGTDDRHAKAETLAAEAIENLRIQLEQKRIVHPPAEPTRKRTGDHERVLLRLRDVCQMVGLSRSTIYKRIAEGQFPEPIRLGERTVRWSAEAISVWWQTQSNAERNALG